MPKRGDRVAPPPAKGAWKVVFGTSEAASSWDEVCNHAPGPVLEAWKALCRDPRHRDNPERQERLRGDYATRSVGGRDLEQWQFEITGAGRIWYCIDDVRRVVLLMRASIGHPRETDR